MAEYEYRVVDRSGQQQHKGKSLARAGAWATFLNQSPEQRTRRYSPYSIERRLVGAWEPVEQGETDG